MTTLKTARLRLRLFREDDFEDYARLCADPEVMRNLGHGHTLGREDAWRQMAFFLGHWQLRGFGMWAVEERGRLGIIGRVGFHQPEGWPGFELGWALARDSWGKGYATEAARAALQFAFTELGRDRVISLIHADNTRSIRVAERVGERLEGRVEEWGKELSLYAIERTRWDKGTALSAER